MKKILFILSMSVLTTTYAQLELTHSDNFAVPLDDIYGHGDALITSSGEQYITYMEQNTTLDVVIEKIDACGNNIWSKTYDSGYNDNAVKLAEDASGNIYIAGNWINGMERPLILKYSSAGTLLNSNEYYLTAGATIYDMTMVGTDMFLIGKHATSTQGDNGWLGKFNSSLAFQWSRSMDDGTNANDSFKNIKSYGSNIYISGLHLIASYTTSTGALNWSINTSTNYLGISVDGSGVYVVYNNVPYTRIRKYTLGGVFSTTYTQSMNDLMSVRNMKIMNGDIYTIGARVTAGGYNYAAIWKLSLTGGTTWFSEYDNPNNTNESIDTYYFDAFIADNGELVAGGYLALGSIANPADRQFTVVRYDDSNGDQFGVLNHGTADQGYEGYQFLQGQKDDFYIYHEFGSGTNSGKLKRFAYRPADFYSLNGTSTKYYCEGSTASLNINIPAGYSFSWNGFVDYSNASSASTNASIQNGFGPATSAFITLEECMAQIEIPLVEESIVPNAIYIDDVYYTTDQTISICEGDSVKVQGIANNDYQYEYNLAPNPFTIWGNEVHYIKEPGTYLGYALNIGTINLCDSPVPQITVEILSSTVDLGSDVEFCQGETVTLDAGTGMDTYLWSTGENSQTIVVNSTDNYSVDVTKNGCDASGSVNVTVNSLPTIIANATSESICEGQSTTLTGSGGNSYSWDNGVSNGVPFSPTTTDAYTVTGTDANGCENTDVITIEVKSNPTVSANASNTTVCENDPIQLFGSGADSYAWSNGVTNNVAFAATTTTTYTVTGTATNGCTDQDQIQITVNAAPNVSISATDSTICYGESTDLIASGAQTYNWVQAISGSNPTVSPNSTTNYTVTGTGANGCDADASLLITVNQLPNVLAVASDSSICEGESILLYGEGATSYSWSNGATNNSPYTPTSTQSYTVTGTDNNGCVNTDNVVVDWHATPNVNINSSTPTVCYGGDVTFNGAGAIQFEYSDGVIDGVAFQAYTTHEYSVIGTDAYGCQGTDTYTVTVTPLDDATFNYGSSTLCLDGGNQSPTITGLSNGTFSATNSLVIDINTGVIDPLASGEGTYTVTYAVNVVCPNSEEVEISITSSPESGFSYSQLTFCEDDANIYSPSFDANASAGQFTSDIAGLEINIATGAIDISQSNPGDYTITNTIPASGGCPMASSDVNITINSMNVATVAYNATYFTSDSDPNPVVTGTSGTFSESSGNIVFVDSSTGQIDISASTVGGPYEIVYTTSGDCPTTVSSFVTIESNLGVEDIKTKAFTVYPNPFNSIVNIESTDAVKVISVYSTAGQLIYRDNINQINTTNWESGTYILEVEFENEVVRKPIIKI